MDESENKQVRKSLAVDIDTYNLLQSICERERRSKIDQLKVLIEKEDKRLNSLINA
jgi:hypothetical protein